MKVIFGWLKYKWYLLWGTKEQKIDRKLKNWKPEVNI